MAERSVTHASFVIERNYPVKPQRVFAAFSDPAKKQRWFAPDDGSQIGSFEMDFRPGGRETRSFRASNGVVYTNHTTYQDIVPDRRIVLAYTMGSEGKPMSASLSTFEFLATETGTSLVFTEQAAFFEHSDGAKMREDGWRLLLDRLAKDLAS